MDPLRFARIEALARRAACEHGGLRRVLDARLAELVGAYVTDLAAPAPRPERPGPALKASRPGQGAMAVLLAQFEGRLVARDRVPSEAAGGQARPAATELDEVRRISARARTESQLRQALDDAPEDAGPLNSANLVHRALNLMRDVSPGYLQAFMGYVDSLAWLGGMALEAGPATAQPPASAADGKRPRGPQRGRPRRRP